MDLVHVTNRLDTTGAIANNLSSLSDSDLIQVIADQLEIPSVSMNSANISSDV